MTDRQDELLEQLATLTKDGFPKAREEWEKSVAAWGTSYSLYLCHEALMSGCSEKRQEKVKAGSEAGTVSTPTAGDTHLEEGGAASGAEGEGASGTAKHDGTRDAHPPAQKYRLTEAMKSIIWQLVMLSNECCRLENEKKCVASFGLAASFIHNRVHSDLEGNNAQVSEQGSRKVLYQKVSGVCLVSACKTQLLLQIVAAFPAGWLNSGQISREGTQVPICKFRRFNALPFL